MPKRLRFIPALLIFSLVFIFSCKTDFNVNAPYKEVNVVYGLLESHNDVQIIKISKLYQNSSGQTALHGAQQFDSLYQKDSLDVTLSDVSNGTYVKLEKYLFTQKDPGIFAAPNEYLYRTPFGFTLTEEHTYTLSIYNPATKVTATGSTVIVGDAISERPNNTSLVNFPNTVNGFYPVSFNVGKNAWSYDFDILIPIMEYRKSDSVLIKRDTLDWIIFRNYSQFRSNQSSKIFYNISGPDFYSFLKANLKADNTIYRKIGLIDFTYTGAGEELANYINVNTPSLGVVQKKPDYTNISNGAGIFSSRQHTTIRVPLADPTWDILHLSDATRALNFVR